MDLESNLIETQRIETSSYSKKAYFAGEYFLYCRKIISVNCRYQFKKSLYLNGNTEFYESIIALLEKLVF